MARTSDLRYQAFEGLIRREGSFDLKLVREGLRDREPHIRLRAAEEILERGLDAEALDVVESLALLPATGIRALDVLNRRGDPQRTAALARSLLPKVLEKDERMRGYDAGYRFAVVHTLEVVRDRQAVPGPRDAVWPRPQPELPRRAGIGGDWRRYGQETLVRAMDSPDASARALGQEASSAFTLGKRPRLFTFASHSSLSSPGH